MGLNEWIHKYYWDNLFSITLENVILVGLFFLILGGKTNEQAPFIQFFLIMFIPKATIQIPITGLVKCRIAFLRGRWGLKVNEPLSKIGKLTNPWRYLGLTILILGIGAAIPISFVAFIINDLGIWSSIITGFIAFFSTLILSIIMVQRYPRDLALFSDRVLNSEQEQDTPESFSKYLMLEYFGPWCILVFLINLVINYKSYAEKSMNPFGTASIELMILDTFIVAGVIIYWMWDVSQNQVRPDVHLRRLKKVAPQSSRKIFLKLIIIYFSLGLAIFGATIGMLYVMKLYRLSPLQGAIVLSLEATIAAIIGCSLGVWFGMNREYQFMRKKGL